MRTNYFHPLTAFGLCLAALVADQCMKHYVQSHIPMHSSLAIHPMLTLTHTHNYGVTLSAFAKRSTESQYVMAIMALCLLIALSLYAGKRMPCARTRYGLALAWAGGMSNAIDRLWHGGVIDYLWFHVGDWHWPAVINIADLCICLGCAMLALQNQTATPQTPSAKLCESAS